MYFAGDARTFDVSCEFDKERIVPEVLQEWRTILESGRKQAFVQMLEQSPAGKAKRNWLVRSLLRLVIPVIFFFAARCSDGIDFIGAFVSGN